MHGSDAAVRHAGICSNESRHFRKSDRSDRKRNCRGIGHRQGNYDRDLDRQRRQLLAERKGRKCNARVPLSA
jgi:hypothetical protein